MDGILNSFKFEVSTSNENGTGKIQDKLFSLCRYDLSPALRGAFGDRIGRFDRLELDIGDIAYSALDVQLIPRIIAALESKLKAWDSIEGTEPLPDLIEELRQFLEKGARHWSQKALDIDQEIPFMIISNWPGLFTFLKTTKFQQQVAQRLVYHLSQSNYEALIHKLQPTEGGFVLGFVADMVAQRRQTNLLIPEASLEEELKTFVLVDLVKNHDSLFNRKMFVRRQLLSLSNHFRVDYQELLLLLKSTLQEIEITYRFRSTLPGLIDEIVRDTVKLPSPLAEKDELPWEFLFQPHRSADKQELLQVHWDRWVREYAGELTHSLKTRITTLDQVERLTADLHELGKIDSLIKLLEPASVDDIITYKKLMMQTQHQEQLVTSGLTDFDAQIDVFILSFLLLDRGSRFNNKQFLKYQIRKISQHFGKSFFQVLALVTKHTLRAGNARISGKLFKILKEIEEEERGWNPPEQLSTTEEMALVRTYLMSGLVDWQLLAYGHLSHKKQLAIVKRTLLQGNDAGHLLHFLEEQQDDIIRILDRFDQGIFDSLIAFLVKWKAKLIKLEQTRLLDLLSEKMSSKSNRRSIFKSLISFRKLDRAAIVSWGLKRDGRGKTGSLTFQYLSRKLLQGQPEKALPEVPTKPSISLLFNLIPGKAGFASLRVEDKKLLEASFTHLVQDTTRLRQMVSALKQSQWETLMTVAGEETLLSLYSGLVSLYGLSADSTFSKLDASEQRRFLLRLTSWGHDRLLKRKPLDKQLFQLLQNFGFAGESAVAKSQVQDSEDEELVAVRQFLTDGTIRKGFSLEVLESVILKWHMAKDARIISVFKDQQYTSVQMSKWSQKFSDQVLIRVLQVFLGRQITKYLFSFSRVEKLLSAVLKDSQDAFTRSTLWKRKILFGYIYGNRPLSVEQVLRFEVRQLSGESAAKFQAMLNQIHGAVSSEKVVLSNADKMLIQNLVNQPLETPDDEVAVADPPEESTVAEASGYLVENAGIVLLWPYFGRLFAQLGLLDDHERFKSVADQIRAISILQYTATGMHDFQEYQISLLKKICGMELAQPVNQAASPLLEHEQELIKSMLEGAISNWPQLGNTSVEGFRNSFLLRRGTLRLEDNTWTLRVERSGIDVLLDSIPWPITNVKLPWMDEVLYVAWR